MFSALLDTCVLVPGRARDVLLEIASTGAYRPLWSSEVVTDNLADFPPTSLPAPLTRQSLDDFLLDSLGLYPGQVMSALRSVASRTGKYGPAMTVNDIAAYLQAHGTPGFGEQLLALLERIGSAGS